MNEEKESEASENKDGVQKCGEIESFPRPGDICPRCGKAKLEYNGLLNLECTLCHYEVQGGAFT